MANVSPGVFTKIIDLSAFVQAVPSTIGFLCGFTKKGRDNELVFVGSRSELISEFGEPNIVDFGKKLRARSLYWIQLFGRVWFIILDQMFTR